jgi:hypothetical protein
MNAKGQPAFYGATTVPIALAEVRPPVGAWVATAAFDLLRPVKLLDLRNLAQVQLDSTLSLFDPRSIEKAQRRDFLRTLSSQLIQPVMPELQDRDYLITQVIADYLATHKRGQVEGIIYPSVQRPKDCVTAGFNVVLFPKASRVEGANGRPLGQAYLWEDEEDGPGRYLSPQIWEFNDKTTNVAQPLGSHLHLGEAANHWPATLTLVRSEIEVHEVRGVEVATFSKPVDFVHR